MVLKKINSKEIIKKMPIGVLMLNLDFKVQLWNKTMEEITNVTAEVILGSNLFNRFPKIAESGLSEIYQRSTESANVIYLENCILSATDSQQYKQQYYNLIARVIRQNDTTVGSIIILEETTSRYMSEIALRESERRLSTLMNNLPGMAYRILNDRHWTLEFVSKGSMDLIGYDSGYLQGNSINRFSERVHPEDQKKVRETIDAAVKSKTTFELFYRLITTNDNYKWVWEQGSGVFDESGKLVALEGYVNDFSAPKVTELELSRENERLRSSIKDRYRFGDMIGKSEGMQKVYELILKAASTDTNVIIYGESGTGKELVAKAIHNLSERSNKPFVPVNCGAFSEYLLENEFFGHVKGAFTGADREKAGYLDTANKGTLFLDELGEISLSLQVKLLRVLDGKGYSPVGSTKIKKSNVRIVAATNRNLKEDVKTGKIRQDFFYRIHVLSIYLPQLKDRKEDIPLLIDYFLNKYKQEDQKKDIPQVVMKTLLNYHWPGNVRELQNTILRYVTLNEIDLIDDNLLHDKGSPVNIPEFNGNESNKLKNLLDVYEKRIIFESLNQNQWKRGKVAQLLGIDRKTLFTKIKRHQLLSP